MVEVTKREKRSDIKGYRSQRRAIFLVFFKAKRNIEEGFGQLNVVCFGWFFEECEKF